MFLSEHANGTCYLFFFRAQCMTNFGMVGETLLPGVEFACMCSSSARLGTRWLIRCHRVAAVSPCLSVTASGIWSAKPRDDIWKISARMELFIKKRSSPINGD